MQALLVLLFSTFVAASLVAFPAFAAKETPAPDLGDTASAPSAPVNSTNEIDKSTLDLPPKTAAPNFIAPAGSPTYFHAYHNGFTLHAGAMSTRAPLAVSNHSSYSPALAGLQLMGTLDSGTALEAGADLMSDGTGTLSFAWRWIDGQDAFRPYVKAGLGLWINPDDQLGALINFENLRLLAAVGFEEHVTGRSSVRLEVEGGAGSTTSSPYPMQIEATLGWVWAW